MQLCNEMLQGLDSCSERHDTPYLTPSSFLEMYPNEPLQVSKVAQVIGWLYFFYAANYNESDQAFDQLLRKYPLCIQVLTSRGTWYPTSTDS